MLFKDLKVGDVFKLIKGDTTFIKISSVNDNEYPFKRYFNYPSNVLIIDKLHYGVVSPRAAVYRVKEYHGKEQEKTRLKELLEKHESDIHRQNFLTYGGVPKEVVQYSKADCINTYEMQIALDIEKSFLIKKVIFNDPATIVCWFDGTKTVVKCQNGEKFDKEKGLALCFMKKVKGNKSNFNNVFKEWIKPTVTTFYDVNHPELGIQDIPPKNKKKFPKDICRITTSDVTFLHQYMQDNGITDQKIADASGLSVRTVKRALTGYPVLNTTISKISEYFDFPIDTTRYRED